MAERRYNILTPTAHGTMIVNRFDHQLGVRLSMYGVSDEQLLDVLLALVTELKASTHRPIVIADVGAHVGAASVPLGVLLEDDGMIHAFEPQRLIHYMLCGNVAIASLRNIYCHQLAVSDRPGRLELPCYQLDKRVDTTAFQVEPRAGGRFDGSPTGASEPVELVSLDSFGLAGLDILRIDVEGMESKVLAGAANLIARHRPAIMFAAAGEPKENQTRFLRALGYELWSYGDDVLALPTGRFELAPAVARIDPP